MASPSYTRLSLLEPYLTFLNSIEPSTSGQYRPFSAKVFMRMYDSSSNILMISSRDFPSSRGLSRLDHNRIPENKVPRRIPHSFDISSFEISSPFNCFTFISCHRALAFRYLRSHFSCLSAIDVPMAFVFLLYFFSKSRILRIPLDCQRLTCRADASVIDSLHSVIVGGNGSTVQTRLRDYG